MIFTRINETGFQSNFNSAEANLLFFRLYLVASLIKLVYESHYVLFSLINSCSSQRARKRGFSLPLPGSAQTRRNRHFSGQKTRSWFQHQTRTTVARLSLLMMDAPDRSQSVDLRSLIELPSVADNLSKGWTIASRIG